MNVFVRKAGNTCSNLFSKAGLDSVKGWDENLVSSQETDLMMRILLEGGTFVCDQKPLTIIRERTSGQISQSNPAKRWENIVKYRISYIEKILEIPYNQKIRTNDRFFAKNSQNIIYN